MEAWIMSQLNEELFSFVIEMDWLSNISNSSICSQAFVEHRNIALSHSLAIVLSYNIWVIAIDTPIIHVILQVEESKRREHIDNDH